MASRLSRRQFIGKSVTGAAGVALAPLAGPTLGALGANERIRVAVAGINGRGHSHISAFAQAEGVEVAYLCDPDSRIFKDRIKLAQEKSRGRSNPRGVQDIRRILEDKTIDVISIATPNHWHSLMTIWACEAGKDVYVEKPMSHNIHEGRVAVETARRCKRIVQHGTQSRSDAKWARVAAVVRSGKLGKLRISRGLCYKAGGGWTTRGDIGFAPITPPPEGLDFDLWQGPAVGIQHHANLVHYRWHWFWATGNGDIGNQGVHQMDIARWCIPGATLPKSVIAFGGRLLNKLDQGETANTQIAIMDFGETQLIFETRGLPSKPFHGVGVGNILHFDEGMIVDGKFLPKGSDKEAPLPEVEFSRGPGGGDHFANFLAAVRSRKTSDLNADVLEGHYSSALCHLANMSIRLGYKVPFEPRTKALGENEAAYETLDRTMAYLKENGIDVEHSGYVMGRRLVVDAAEEKIADDPEANGLLTRAYRKGFEVPA